MSETALLQADVTDEITEICKILRRRIVRRELPPGTRLLEQVLASEFNVSRAKIREVFTLLEQRELVARQSNRGAVVRHYSLPELLSRFDIVEVLFGLSVRLATQQTPPSTWHEWLNLFEGPMEHLLKDGNIREYLGNINRLQQQISKASNNEPLQALVSQHTDIIGPYLKKALMLSNYAQVAVYQHKLVLEAMVKGDAESAETLRREQLKNSREILERYYDLLI